MAISRLFQKANKIQLGADSALTNPYDWDCVLRAAGNFHIKCMPSLPPKNSTSINSSLPSKSLFSNTLGRH